MTLVRANTRALLARCAGYNGGPGDEFLVYVFHIYKCNFICIDVNLFKQ